MWDFSSWSGDAVPAAAAAPSTACLMDWLCCGLSPSGGLWDGCQDCWGVPQNATGTPELKITWQAARLPLSYLFCVMGACFGVPYFPDKDYKALSMNASVFIHKEVVYVVGHFSSDLCYHFVQTVKWCYMVNIDRYLIHLGGMSTYHTSKSTQN